MHCQKVLAPEPHRYLLYYHSQIQPSHPSLDIISAIGPGLVDRRLILVPLS